MTYVSQYVQRAPWKIDEERYIYMLEVLPPSRWYRGDHVQFFHVCEYLTDNLVAWYARVGNGKDATYWEMWDSPTLTKEEVLLKLHRAINAAGA